MPVERFPDLNKEHGFEYWQWTVGDNLAEADRIAQELAETLHTKGWTKDEIGEIELATKEIVVNGILHGNKQDPNKKVAISMNIEKTEGKPDEAIVKVTDEGEGFDPSKIPNPVEGEGLTKTSGRGILMAKAYMDSVEILPGEPTVVFRKKKTAKGTDNENA